MKKLLTTVLVALFVAVLPFSFVGCKASTKQDNNPEIDSNEANQASTDLSIVGSYKLESCLVEVEGGNLNETQKQNIKAEYDVVDDCVLVLKNNYTGISVISTKINDELHHDYSGYKFNWTLNGTNLSLTNFLLNITATVEDDKIFATQIVDNNNDPVYRVTSSYVFNKVTQESNSEIAFGAYGLVTAEVDVISENKTEDQKLELANIYSDMWFSTLYERVILFANKNGNYYRSFANSTSFYNITWEVIDSFLVVTTTDSNSVLVFEIEDGNKLIKMNGIESGSYEDVYYAETFYYELERIDESFAGIYSMTNQDIEISSTDLSAEEINALYEKYSDSISAIGVDVKNDGNCCVSIVFYMNGQYSAQQNNCFWRVVGNKRIVAISNAAEEHQSYNMLEIDGTKLILVDTYVSSSYSIKRTITLEKSEEDNNAAGEYFLTNFNITANSESDSLSENVHEDWCKTLGTYKSFMLNADGTGTILSRSNNIDSIEVSWILIDNYLVINLDPDAFEEVDTIFFVRNNSTFTTTIEYNVPNSYSVVCEISIILNKTNESFVLGEYFISSPSIVVEENDFTEPEKTYLAKPFEEAVNDTIKDMTSVVFCENNTGMLNIVQLEDTAQILFYWATFDDGKIAIIMPGDEEYDTRIFTIGDRKITYLENYSGTYFDKPYTVTITINFSMPPAE